MRLALPKLANVSSSQEYRTRLYSMAFSILVRHKWCAAEITMDKYCIKNYDIPLKLLCLKILNNIKINKVDDNFIAIIQDASLEKMARLITYGNESVQGSTILTDMLFRN